MDDEAELHPLDILTAYAAAGIFIETRLKRLRLQQASEDELIAAEGMSDVLFSGIVFATSLMSDDVQLVTESTSPARMMS